MSSTKFVFLGPIGKPRWPPLPLIEKLTIQYYENNNYFTVHTIFQKQESFPFT